MELWLGALALSPKSKAHIRGLLSVIWDYAMWRGDVPTQRNPMELVTVKGATKRTRRPRSLTVDEFQNFAQQLDEPFRTMALLCCCLGLRISECLGLKWSDVDWLNGRLLVERGIVCQNVDDVKTDGSRKQMVIAGEIIAALQSWKQATQFSARRIGYLLRRSSSGGCHGHMTKCGASIKKQQRLLASAALALTRSGTRTAAGWTPLAHRLACNRN